ncbi:MAG: sigma-70 family RNA polymerase sigma factor [Candidatus Cloacimonetes bacterium]|nr:sigma-70 family RNA polymerase sigma factor [Candidatus Cloacimonadota bacterium]MCF7813613.1 sigma-70 family RNA polymerase sigma factor [Candidatus Cloacimonadota bacterium]MCF7867929.1 sigma-70 family RNA polymerase sigma factor [Candidatus Cloacimonadota bacterium]MCF7882878.1 sigma-70 family RNA polymerase sigma factor [Candidatus Cloacimonadota bacterium]
MIRARQDLKEFDYLYRKYFPKINNFVFHRVNSESDRHEIVSNVFFKAMKKISLFQYLDSRKCSFSSWLYRIAVNEINQFYRNKKRSKKIIDTYIFNQVDGTEMGINYELVRDKLQKFDMEDQNMIALKYFEKLSYKEIGEIYKKSEGAMKVKVHRLINKLRDEINKEIENERS